MKNDIRTILNEIKKDIENDYRYMEYESKSNGWDRIWILSRYSTTYRTGEIIFHYENNTHIFSGIIPIDEFMSMTNKEIIKYLAEYYYYNTFEKEIEN